MLRRWCYKISQRHEWAPIFLKRRRPADGCQLLKDSLLEVALVVLWLRGRRRDWGTEQSRSVLLLLLLLLQDQEIGGERGRGLLVKNIRVELWYAWLMRHDWRRLTVNRAVKSRAALLKLAGQSTDGLVRWPSSAALLSRASAEKHLWHKVSQRRTLWTISQLLFCRIEIVAAGHGKRLRHLLLYEQGPL